MKQIPPRLLLNPIHCLSLGFGAGTVSKAPGTAGTVVGILAYLLLQELALEYYLGIVFLLYMVGIWMCAYTANILQRHDHPAIVWDEIVGYLVTMILAPSGWLWIFVGFILFRIFDIWKPWPINLVDKQLKGGHGIMADDLLAGIFSLTVMQIIAYILYR